MVKVKRYNDGKLVLKYVAGVDGDDDDDDDDGTPKSSAEQILDCDADYDDSDADYDDSDADYDDGDPPKSSAERYIDDKLNSVTRAIINDDMPRFVAEMKWFCWHQLEPDIRKHSLIPSWIMIVICGNRPLRCATALLEGKACVFAPLNIPINGYLNPLDSAALHLDYDFVKLLLSHGARADMRAEGNPFPVNTSLEALNRHKYLFEWTPEESIFKMVIILCLPQMKVALETNRLLALNTKDINEVFIGYVKEAKLIEIAVLLMVAYEPIMAPSTFESTDGTVVKADMIHRKFMGAIECQVKEREASIWTRERSGMLAQTCYGKREAALMFTLVLLTIFERVGDALRSYIQAQQSHVPKERVVNDVASILREAGFVLKDKDIDLSNIDCESDEIKGATGTSENVTAYESKRYCDMLLYQCGTTYMAAQKAKEKGRKDYSSILKEACCALKDMDIDLSNIGCESDMIKEAFGSAEDITAYNSETYPLDVRFLDAKWNRRFRPPNPQLYQLKGLKGFNTRRSFSSSSAMPPNRCSSPVSCSACFKHLYKGENNTMKRHMPPSTSRNLLASLALSFKRGIIRL